MEDLMKNRIDRRTMIRLLGAGACGAGLAPILSGCESGLIHPDDFKAREASPLIFWLWVGASVYFAALSIWRSLKPGAEAK
jgi:hypothetical protein